MAATYTPAAAAERHAGVSAKRISQMCLRGELKARKVGGDWIIPAAELDRVFLGRSNQKD